VQQAVQTTLTSLDTKWDQNTWDKVEDLGNIQMQQIKNSVSTPFGDF
jgi:hypothetical protein